MCITRRRIPASASTNSGTKKGDLLRLCGLVDTIGARGREGGSTGSGTRFRARLELGLACQRDLFLSYSMFNGFRKSTPQKNRQRIALISISSEAAHAPGRTLSSTLAVRETRSVAGVPRSQETALP